MELTFFEIFVLTFAAMQVVETWKHGSLFDEPRGKMEVRGGFIADMLSCAFCFSHWAAGVLVLGALVAKLQTPTWPWTAKLAAWMVWLGIYALAVTRLSQIAHDLVHPISRSPDPNFIPTESPEEI